MKIVPGDITNQFLCLHPDTGLMIGLIQTSNRMQKDEFWRIELFMRLQGKTNSKEEALAFAHGAWAAVEAFGLLTPPKGIQDVQTKTVVRDAVKQKIKEMDDDMHAGLDRYTGSERHLIDIDEKDARPPSSSQEAVQEAIKRKRAKDQK